jgi:hypothetical protein
MTILPALDGPAYNQTSLQPRIRLYGYIAYFALLFVSFLPYLASDLCYLDELTFLAESKRLYLFGEHQHRDFFNFHGTANFFLVAFVWKLLGRVDHLSIKLLTFITVTFGAILLTLIARRYTKRFWLSLLPSLIFAGYLGHSFPFSNHHWFGSVASIIFLFFLTRYLERLDLKNLYYCGLTSALSLLFIMHEGTVNTLVGFFVVAATILLIHSTSASSETAELKRPAAVKLLFVYLTGFATLAIPAIVYYLSIGALGQYFYNTFLWPFTNYAQPTNINNRTWAADIHLWAINGRDLLGTILFYVSSSSIFMLLVLPVIAIFSGGVMLVALLRPVRASNDRRLHYLQLLSLVSLSVGIYATAFSQPTLIKLLWGSVPATILSVQLADLLAERLREKNRVRGCLALLLAFFMISVAVTPLYRWQKIFRGDESELAGTESADAFEHPLVELINQESGPEDYYFGYYAASLFYYLVNARPATQYILFFQDFLTDEQLEGMFNDIERHKPKFMTFSTEQDLLWLAGKSESFTKLLNDDYRFRGRVENWLVYERAEDGGRKTEGKEDYKQDGR